MRFARAAVLTCILGRFLFVATDIRLGYAAVQEIRLKTERRTQLVDITKQVQKAVNSANGAVAALVYVPHTTAGVTINEGADPAVAQDLGRQSLRVPALHLRHARADRVAGETPADEDDEPVQPCDAVAAVRE